jgi:hypothetical protein
MHELPGHGRGARCELRVQPSTSSELFLAMSVELSPPRRDGMSVSRSDSTEACDFQSGLMTTTFRP